MIVAPSNPAIWPLVIALIVVFAFTVVMLSVARHARATHIWTMLISIFAIAGITPLLVKLATIPRNADPSTPHPGDSMLSLPAFALPIIVIGCLAAGFLAGRLQERLRWNALIEDGILPKPRRR